MFCGGGLKRGFDCEWSHVQDKRSGRFVVKAIRTACAALRERIPQIAQIIWFCLGIWNSSGLPTPPPNCRQNKKAELPRRGVRQQHSLLLGLGHFLYPANHCLPHIFQVGKLMLGRKNLWSTSSFVHFDRLRRTRTAVGVARCQQK